jgi:hypothetical protein
MPNETETVEAATAKAVWTVPELIDLNSPLNDVHNNTGTVFDGFGGAPS